MVTKRKAFMEHRLGKLSHTEWPVELKRDLKHSWQGLKEARYPLLESNGDLRLLLILFKNIFLNSRLLVLNCVRIGGSNTPVLKNLTIVLRKQFCVLVSKCYRKTL